LVLCWDYETLVCG